MDKLNLNRRDFIKVLSVGGTGLLVGCTFNSHNHFSASNEKSKNLTGIMKMKRKFLLLIRRGVEYI